MFHILPKFHITPKRIAELHSLVDGSESNFLVENYDNEEDWKEVVHDHIDDLESIDPSREVGFFYDSRTMRHPFWITGGMSWGEKPTEACNTFEILDDCVRLYDKMAEWSIADFGKQTPTYASQETIDQIKEWENQEDELDIEGKVRRERDKLLDSCFGG